MTVMTFCKTHSNVEAVFTCASCMKPMCDNCAVYGDDNRIVCRECQRLAQQASHMRQADTPIDLAPLGAPAPPVAPARRTTSFCANHPENPAVAWCAECRSLICATCDFAFPGGIHLCPACATNPKQKVSPGRKTKMTSSIILGAIGLAGTGGMILLAFALGPRDREAMGALGCGLILFGIAALVGFILAITCFNRKAHNPGYFWLGIVLNGLVLAFWALRILQMMAGAAMR